MTDDTRVCKTCGQPKLLDEFEQWKSGYRRIVCKACVHTGRKARGTACGLKPSGILAECGWCGVTFEPKEAKYAVYCTKRCAGVGNAAKRMGVGAFSPIPWRTCAACGQEFYARSPRGQLRRVCGRQCELEANRRRARELWKSVAETNPVVRHRCWWCGRSFETRKNSARRRFCSFQCGRSSSKSIRRARLAEVPVERVSRFEIWKRDRGVCQLCGLPIDRRQRAPEPMGPTLDHIIPLARGGPHTLDNLQLAHFICNSRKGDTVAGVGG